MATWTLFTGRKKWDPAGRHCYVTGGSAGLGLSLAILLTKMGAHVSIIARNEERLERALEEMEKVRQSPDQLLKAYSYSLTEAAAAAEAFDVACEVHQGKPPDAVFLCAGTSYPGFFIEEDEASMKRGMEQSYWIQAWSALHAVKRMVRAKSTGKIVFVSSFLGYMSMIGYSSYAPGKHAVRGKYTCSETLRSELQLYSIGVHIFFPGTILSPGYIEENKRKPQITLKIEERDETCRPDEAAQALLHGIQKGYFHITTNYIGEFFRVATQGSTPHNNALLDTLMVLVSRIGITDWRRGVDKVITSHRPEHQGYLASKGILPAK
ncbi:hypothetical protein AX16_003199 [Volvariella volvacea WC 439]|nr:hypothetical protein AX16_003199 [Volvariella volvacea WC 439]